jgi:hypothetical protein
MNMKLANKDIVLTLILVLAVMFLSLDYLVVSYDQTNITTLVNVTNSIPEIIAVSIDGGVPIDLIEGSTKTVECNITVRDYNGNADVNYLNATLYSTDYSTRDAALDNNTNYFLETPVCTNTSQTANTAIYSCDFEVWYFAYNGTWECNASVTDSYGYSGNGANTSTINPLYAINVTSVIDYGNMAVGDTSTSSETANVTNFGNMNINISVFGYGGTDFATGNNLAFICEQGNITVDNKRYSAVDQAWATMTSLTNESAIIGGLTVLNQDTEIPVFNQTYWRLYVPPNPFGQCNGTVVFEAELP